MQELATRAKVMSQHMLKVYTIFEGKQLEEDF